MIITIKYRAKLSWDIYTDVLCEVEHKIDKNTLQTVDFIFVPIETISPESY